MNDFGRIVACGMISRYNDAEHAPGPPNIINIVTRRLRMQGFIVIDYLARFAEAALQLGVWAARRQAAEPRARGRRVPLRADRGQHAVHRREHRQARGEALMAEAAAESPRLAPKPNEDWDDDTRALIGDNPLNIFATLAHHPKLMKRWMVFGNHVLAKSTLPARDRELADPAHGLELPVAVRVGPARRDRARRSASPTTRSSASPPVPTRRVGIRSRRCLRARGRRAALRLRASPTRPTRALAERYDEQQLLDLVFTVGQYHVVSMALNSMRVRARRRRDRRVDPGSLGG